MKKKISVIVSCAVLFLLALTIGGQHSAAKSPTYVYKVNENLYVHEAMDVQSRKTGSLPKNAVIFVQPINNNWVYVPNKKGYVEASKVARQQGLYHVVATKDTIPVRKTATKSGKVVANAFAKSVVIKYTEVAGGWSFVNYGGTYGYMPTSVLQLPNSKPVTIQNAKGAELRKLATRSAPVIDTIPAKTQLKEYSSFVGWSFVGNDTYSGYVKTADLAKQTPPKPEPPKPGTKKIALTFDDGPSAKVTPQILAILKKYNAKATFFVLGQEAQKYPKTLKQIAADGHQIGNHSWNHRDLTKLSIYNAQQDLTKTNKMVASITGVTPKTYRPPYGAITQQMRQQINMKPVLWNVDTLDWQHRNPAKTLANVKKNARNGSVVLMHDIHQTTADALENVIIYLRDQGYSFVTIDQL